MRPRQAQIWEAQGLAVERGREGVAGVGVAGGLCGGGGRKPPFL